MSAQPPGLEPSLSDNTQPLAKSLFVSVGDISADLHAARLIDRLKEMCPGLKVRGVGGSAMEASGVELLQHCQALSVIGPVEGLKLLPRLSALAQRIIAEIESNKPDAVLLVDYGGFNLKLAARIRKCFPALPIIYFISPQVWGSRPWRIKAIEQNVSAMLVIFPFEEALLRARNIKATFVGHPLTEKFACLNQESKEEFCRKYALDGKRPLVGIFPGSRTQEIKDFMSFLLQAINWLAAERQEVQFALSLANQHIADKVQEEIYRLKLERLIGSRLKLVNASDNFSLMAAADILWTKSGTTTLEAALMEKPMLVFYRAYWLSFLLFLLFKQVKYVAWPNLLAGKMLVPELIQLDCRAELLVKYTRDWLDVPGYRQELSESLRSIKSRLGKGDFARNAAQSVANILGARPAATDESMRNGKQETGNSP